ncbi:MAG TPA: hypothetical protein VKU82_12795, partial [Planctomycetaceae bacterium]|nr:hypothetical protein [Planctomycetaceae bacterium]
LFSWASGGPSEGPLPPPGGYDEELPAPGKGALGPRLGVVSGTAPPEPVEAPERYPRLFMHPQTSAAPQTTVTAAILMDSPYFVSRLTLAP